MLASVCRRRGTKLTSGLLTAFEQNRADLAIERQLFERHLARQRRRYSARTHRRGTCFTRMQET